LSATRDWLRDRYEGSNNVLFQRDTEALDFAIRELKKPRAMACYYVQSKYPELSRNEISAKCDPAKVGCKKTLSVNDNTCPYWREYKEG